MSEVQYEDWLKLVGKVNKEQNSTTIEDLIQKQIDAYEKEEKREEV